MPTTPIRPASGSAPVRTIELERCLDLLASHGVGRLAVDDGRGPIVLPVNYVLHEGTVTVRTDPGTKLDAAERAAPACFELDEVDEEHGTGWSVVVRGRLVEVTDPDELDRVLAAAPTPFAAGERVHVVQLLPTAITGRWLALQPSVPPHGREVDTNAWRGRDGDDLLA